MALSETAARYHDQRAAEAERELRQLFEMILQPGGTVDMTGITSVVDRVAGRAIALHVHRESARHFRSDDSEPSKKSKPVNRGRWARARKVAPRRTRP